jgi:uncharacterized protein (DUF1778 family)
MRAKLNERTLCLNTNQYDAFVAALDAPPKPRPRLEKLLTTPSILEREIARRASQGT